MNIFTYLFWPNPGNAAYASPKVTILLVVCLALVFISIVLRVWRRRNPNPVARKLSRSWPTAAMWFGIVGLVLVISRVEQISYVSMRVWWIVWIICLIIYAAIQLKLFRSRFYTPLPKEKQEDPRAKYLPKKKKR